MQSLEAFDQGVVEAGSGAEALEQGPGGGFQGCMRPRHGMSMGTFR